MSCASGLDEKHVYQGHITWLQSVIWSLSWLADFSQLYVTNEPPACGRPGARAAAEAVRRFAGARSSAQSAKPSWGNWSVLGAMRKSARELTRGLFEMCLELRAKPGGAECEPAECEPGSERAEKKAERTKSVGRCLEFSRQHGRFLLAMSNVPWQNWQNWQFLAELGMPSFRVESVLSPMQIALLWVTMKALDSVAPMPLLHRNILACMYSPANTKCSI